MILFGQFHIICCFSFTPSFQHNWLSPIWIDAYDGIELFSAQLGQKSGTQTAEGRRGRKCTAWGVWLNVAMDWIRSIPISLAPCLICDCKKQECRDERRQAQIWFTEKREQHNAIRQLWMNDRARRGGNREKEEVKERAEQERGIRWSEKWAGSGVRKRLNCK